MSLPGINFFRTKGKIKISAQVHLVGPDFQIILYGGKAHIGAVASALPECAPVIFARENHRENEIAANMASIIADTLNVCCTVSAGIHYDHISREEIAACMDICNSLTEEICEFFKSRRNIYDCTG